MATNWTYGENFYFWSHVIPEMFDDSDPPGKKFTWNKAAEMMKEKYGQTFRTYKGSSLSSRYSHKRDAYGQIYSGKALAKKVVESLPGKKDVESPQGEDSGATKAQ
ncbi:hypothetical protein H634G_09450 [Metarhizium anisopliae BRIP 53293]|uniref:Uncharacterized protein n=1 Tax=Metarhizium anisopliae BRIP 53293 TaxID=1291518 RepID=A0A0D9NMF1_METAN|nr:hypothetical protein H634G_09450 [Metarhizium anisopliae BRIP 53293]KJK87542.1 hypothetical protein H633G_08580 [Metarhizium anisopliae BRIP 53284]